ncbi:hypothetical protein PIB30_091322 [Stylosanthes scabra]|uniref:Uncharacterized protein n=1 Tax=Stylosanthes scabra TaxID=79078 RepID=A0ABU6SUX3_9FABA|nr:hypothetical protein [Stylosanthes scabra]
MEEREKARTTAPAKRKESRRAVVMKREKERRSEGQRERHEEGQRRGGEEGSGSSRRRRHHSELLPPPKLPLSAPCLVAVPSPTLHRHCWRTEKEKGRMPERGGSHHCCQKPLCLRNPPFQAAVLEPQPPPWLTNADLNGIIFAGEKLDMVSAEAAGGKLNEFMPQ